MEKHIDLHIHTTASDGSDSPAAVVRLAASLGLSAIAITDHDTVSGIAEAQAEAARLGVELVPGIEISADYLGREAHILGLFIDPGAAALRSAADWAVNERAARNRRIIETMAADGFDVSLDELAAAYPDSVLGRPHLAELLTRKGYTASVKDAFDRYLGRGMPYYRPRRRLPLPDAVAAIRASGGLAIVAHPMQYGYDDAQRTAYIDAAQKAGCAGLEAYYSEHSPDQQAELLETAARRGMLVSGGSDYHGTRKPRIRMGSGIENTLFVPYGILGALRLAAGKAPDF